MAIHKHACMHEMQVILISHKGCVKMLYLSSNNVYWCLGCVWNIFGILIIVARHLNNSNMGYQFNKMVLVCKTFLKFLPLV